MFFDGASHCEWENARVVFISPKGGYFPILLYPYWKLFKQYGRIPGLNSWVGDGYGDKEKAS